MGKKNRFRTEELSRMMIYILGHRPYEFGLVPDSEGFISFKELLQVFQEEQDFTYVREGAINEVLLSEKRHLFESRDKLIRAIERRWNLDTKNPLKSIPKMLYTGIREKAHPVVIEKGFPLRQTLNYVLSPSREIAERIGKRLDREPVILEIAAAEAMKQGVAFFCFGDLFFVKSLPPEYITSPPVKRETVKPVEEKPRRKPEQAASAFEPGTFILNAERDPDLSRNRKGKKKRGWKEEARKLRRKP